MDCLTECLTYSLNCAQMHPHLHYRLCWNTLCVGFPCDISPQSVPSYSMRLTLSLSWVLPWHTQLLLNSGRVDPLKHPALATSSSSASSLNDLALLCPLCVSSKPKWLQMTPACLPTTAAPQKRCSFQLHASSHFRCEQKVLDSSNPAPPTAHSPEWCCNFH